MAISGCVVPLKEKNMEDIWYFDRAKTTIMTSNIASIGDLNAFAEDLTIYRAIEREDVKIRDKEAFVNAYLLQK